MEGGGRREEGGRRREEGGGRRAGPAPDLLPIEPYSHRTRARGLKDQVDLPTIIRAAPTGHPTGHQIGPEAPLTMRPPTRQLKGTSVGPYRVGVLGHVSWRNEGLRGRMRARTPRASVLERICEARVRCPQPTGRIRQDGSGGLEEEE